MSEFRRTTKETDIRVTLSQSAQPGHFEGTTGIGFFDHMLTAFCHYSQLNLTLTLQGDFEVDQHHSLEDLGYVLGTCLKQLLEEKPELSRQRFAQCYVPMDESLARAVIDLSGRPFLVLQTPPLKDLIGQLESDCIREFLRAFTDAARITLHLEVLYGTNSHHMVEALFKAIGLALKSAMSPLTQAAFDPSADSSVTPELPTGFTGPNSTKGSILSTQKEAL